MPTAPLHQFHYISFPHTRLWPNQLNNTVKMSENIPESIPTSADHRSHRPAKKARTANTAAGQQSAQVEALFANPDRDIVLPSGQVQRRVAAPPEIVANVQGSSAGAGSGEFHVYKASRRREYERLRVMDEETEREKKDREFEEQREALRRKDEEKLGKNQARRAKAKARKEKSKLGSEVQSMDVDSAKESGGGVKKKLGAAKVAPPVKGGEDGETVTEADGKGVPVEEGQGLMFHDD